MYWDKLYLEQKLSIMVWKSYAKGLNYFVPMLNLFHYSAANIAQTGLTSYRSLKKLPVLGLNLL